jgi:REP element-mobilizing transposase RayT
MVKRQNELGNHRGLPLRETNDDLRPGQTSSPFHPPRVGARRAVPLRLPRAGAMPDHIHGIIVIRCRGEASGIRFMCLTDGQNRILRSYGCQPGAYFVTVRTRDHACLFGHVVNGEMREMRLNNAGEIVRRCCEDIPTHFPHAVLDASVIMPNHIHGVIVIQGLLTHAHLCDSLSANILLRGGSGLWHKHTA